MKEKQGWGAALKVENKMLRDEFWASYGVPSILIIGWQVFSIVRAHTSARTALRTGYNNITIFLFGVFTVQVDTYTNYFYQSGQLLL